MISRTSIKLQMGIWVLILYDEHCKIQRLHLVFVAWYFTSLQSMLCKIGHVQKMNIIRELFRINPPERNTFLRIIQFQNLTSQQPRHFKLNLSLTDCGFLLSWIIRHLPTHFSVEVELNLYLFSKIKTLQWRTLKCDLWWRNTIMWNSFWP